MKERERETQRDTERQREREREREKERELLFCENEFNEFVPSPYLKKWFWCHRHA